jgi:MoxR-like ATPase
MTGALQPPQRVIDAEKLPRLQHQVDQIYVDPALMEYSVRLVSATRDPGMVGQGQVEAFIDYGGSPRASINLILGARALAFLRGREYALPQDVLDLAPDVIRHRMVLSYEALADNVTPDELLDRVIAAVPVPEVAMHDREFKFSELHDRSSA